jgi:hypothetical protein
MEECEDDSSMLEREGEARRQRFFHVREQSALFHDEAMPLMLFILCRRDIENPLKMGSPG